MSQLQKNHYVYFTLKFLTHSIGHFSHYLKQSFAVSNAIYGSRWYEGSIDVKKFIGFVLMRAQKSVVFASGFYVADLDTFSNVGFA